MEEYYDRLACRYRRDGVIVEGGAFLQLQHGHGKTGVAR